MAINWSCPYCNRAQSVVDSHYHHTVDDLKFHDGTDGILATVTRGFLCANQYCRRTTVELSLYPMTHDRSHNRIIATNATPLYKERVRPRGGAKPQPDYIPEVIVADYVEACLIKELSPKASATLARRCLQGMIRGFTGISKGRLVDEIKALKSAVDDNSAPRSVTIESVDAIDHVRNIGNIGAHMEKDINVIVDVDPDEAAVLIELIELLFDEWYVEQHKREERLARITLLGETKAKQLSDARSGQKVLPSPEPD